MSKSGAKMAFKKKQAKGLKFAVVQALFNERFTGALLASLRRRLAQLGAGPKDIRVAKVPGAFELGLAAKELASTHAYDAVICLGAVIRGDTSHYDLVCEAAAQGVLRAGMDTGVPVIFGVLTCETEAQALERCSGGPRDAGIHAAEAAVTMASVLKSVRHGD